MDSISVPDWVTPALIVSIGILFVAIIGVIIAYRKYASEHKPHLKIRNVRCTHKVRYAGQRTSGVIAGTELIVEFEIVNTGVRTSITEVEIRCKPEGQEYRTTERVEPHTITIDTGNQVTYTHQFYIVKRDVRQTPLDCTFILHHTYAKKKIKAKSSLREG